MAEADFSNYGFGKDGVNLVKNPLQLGDGEASQLQNAELRLDVNAVGELALGKRGGFVALNGSALSGGAVMGMLGLNLKTTYVRTLYAGLGTAAANTFRTSTNGTTWANSAAAPIPSVNSKFTDANGERDARRISAFRNFIVYPFNTYTKGTDNPPLAIWDGTEGFTLLTIPIGPSATAATPAFEIVDLLTADGKLYMAIHDPGGSAPDLAGRVMSLNLESGALRQIATAFGNGTGDITGGYPCSLCFYKEQIWVGLQGNTTTDGIGKIVRCYPEIDQTWTSDVATLTGFPCSLAVYKGDLYAGVQTSVSSNSAVYKRTATTNAWAASFTSAAGAGDSGFCGSLIVYGTDLYACEYFSGATDVVHIKKWDGSSWTTDRDVDAVDGVDATNPQMPGNSVNGPNTDLLFAFRPSSGDTTADGFILRKASGTWTKVDPLINTNGMLTVLVTRS